MMTDDLTHYMDATDRMRQRAEVAEAAADAAAEAVGAMAEKLDATILEAVRLREALALVYFHLGPPQPRLTDHAEVPALVEQAMAERDRLRATLDAEREQWLKETRHAASRIGSANRERDRLRAVVDAANDYMGSMLGPERAGDPRKWEALEMALAALDGSEAADG